MSGGRELSRPRVATAALFLLALTACGGQPALPPPSGEANKAAEEILADAQAAMRQVHSFRVASTNEFKDGNSSFTFSFDASGNLSGRLQVPGSQADVVVLAGQPYIRGNAFWSGIYSGSRIPPAQLQVILGKIGTHYVHDPNDVLSLVQDSKQLLPGNLPDCMGVHGKLTRGGTERLNGQRVVVLNDDGSEPGGMPGRYLVADASPHRLLEADSHGPQTLGRLAASGQCPAGSNITAGDIDRTRRTTFTFDQFDTIDPIRKPADTVEVAAQ
ncbi:MAG: hypothetical protein NVSMB17_16370 [Candidatus Dormibacteria bacterium]